MGQVTLQVVLPEEALLTPVAGVSAHLRVRGVRVRAQVSPVEEALVAEGAVQLERPDVPPPVLRVPRVRAEARAAHVAHAPRDARVRHARRVVGERARARLARVGRAAGRAHHGEVERLRYLGGTGSRWNRDRVVSHGPRSYRTSLEQRPRQRSQSQTSELPDLATSEVPDLAGTETA